MCLREKFGNYHPDYVTQARDLGADEILRQFMYLESGLADLRDRRGVSLGLPEELRRRRDNLASIISHSLLNRDTRELVLA